MNAYPVKWVLVKRFAELTGHSEKAIYHKMDAGIWVEGVHFKKCEDGRVRLNLEAYDKWVDAA